MKYLPVLLIALIIILALIKIQIEKGADEGHSHEEAPRQAAQTPPPSPKPAIKQDVMKGVEKMLSTPSGLRYEDMKVGTGPSPKMGDTVVVHYTGWLTNGTEFDSSAKRGVPAEFKLGEVIQGWNEGLAGMKAGGRRKLVIPPRLGYGSKPMQTIPPNSTLVFEVELLDVKPAK